MHLPSTLSSAKVALLTTLVDALQPIPGVVAVVLGGSYARGIAHADSDLDVGLYYHEAAPFSIDAVRAVARSIAIGDGELVVTGFYEWGAWVNGGAWIATRAGKVDFLYRNLDQVERTIAEAHQGIVHHDYPQQPAYGFYSVIYLAETEVCVPLFDPQGVLAALKADVAVYPARLRERVVNDALWSAEFTLTHARAFAAAGDLYNTAGCLTRAAAALTQALFALNQRYFMSDKRAVAIIETLPLHPPSYGARLEAIFGALGATPTTLNHCVDECAMLWRAVVDLTRGDYQPKFLLKSVGGV